jgi:3-oxoadipate enol-lactonase
MSQEGWVDVGGRNTELSRGGWLDVGGGRLRWTAAGEGAPLVLLHGFSFDQRLWDPQVGPLSKQHRVVRYDLRGFGSSTNPAGGYRHIDDLRVLLHSLNIERAVLVGLSLGANVALAYAIQHPQEVAGLVLASPGLAGHHWAVQRPPEAVAAHAASYGVAAGRKFWLEQPIFASTRRYPRARIAVEEMVQGYNGWHWQNADLQQPGPDVRAGLAALPVPALVISGDLDVDGYREIAAEIAAALPNGQLARFADAGHVMNMEEPERFNSRLLEFVGEIATRG